MGAGPSFMMSELCLVRFSPVDGHLNSPPFPPLAPRVSRQAGHDFEAGQRQPEFCERWVKITAMRGLSDESAVSCNL